MQIAAPGVRARMRGGLQGRVGGSQRPIHNRTGIRHDGPITGARFQIVGPGRPRSFAGRKGIEGAMVVIHSRVVCVVAADDLVIVISVGQEASHGNGVIGFQCPVVGRAAQQHGLAVLDQGISRLRGGPTHRGIAETRDRRNIGNERRHGVNRCVGDGIRIVGGVKVTGRDGIPVSDRQLIRGGVASHQGQKPAEQSRVRGFVQGDEDIGGAGTD